MPAHHQRTRRRIRALVLLVLLGLLFNLLVAWGLSLIPHTTTPGNYRSVQMVNPTIAKSQTSLFYNEQQWFGVLEQQYFTQRRSRTQQTNHRISFWWAWSPLVPERDILDVGNELFDRYQPPHPDESVISTTRFGFPAFTLRCQTIVTDPIPNETTSPSVVAHGAIMDENAIPMTVTNGALNSKSSVWPHATYIWFPYQPIWSGLVINTLIYAVLLWALLALFSSFRHARRMLRGTCPFCTYELHYDFTQGCPECGWRRNATENA